MNIDIIKKRLIGNIDQNSADNRVRILHKYLSNLVDSFYEKVIIPLQAEKKFMADHLEYYYEIYKEGVEVDKITKSNFNEPQKEMVEKLIAELKKKSFEELIHLGTTYLADCSKIITQWHRFELFRKRYSRIYNNEHPHMWILNAQHENAFAIDIDKDTSYILSSINLILEKV